jgi:co-chaperonin GroES (HSP10)
MNVDTTYAPSTNSTQKYKGNLKAIGQDILVTNMYFGEEKTAGGIIIGNDDGKERGIKSRWCQVFDIGKLSKLKDDIEIGDWIYVEHGRWSRAVMVEDSEGVEWVIRKVDTECILAVSSEEPPEIQQWINLNKDKTDVAKKYQEEMRQSKNATPAREDGRIILNGKRKGE